MIEAIPTLDIGYIDNTMYTALQTFLDKNKDTQVTLKFMSDGGDAWNGHQMGVLVRKHGQVTSINRGKCYSAVIYPFLNQNT